MYSPSTLFSVLIQMPVPFYTATDHFGKVAGGERENREVRRAESQDEREREMDKGKRK